MIYKCGKEKKSDCVVEVQLIDDIRDIQVSSKMKQLFGRHIENAVLDILDEFDIKGASVLVKDFGALDFVVKARIKTALREALEGGN